MRAFTSRNRMFARTVVTLLCGCPLVAGCNPGQIDVEKQSYETERGNETPDAPTELPQDPARSIPEEPTLRAK